MNSLLKHFHSSVIGNHNFRLLPLLIIPITLSGCWVESYHYWSVSTYKPSDHVFEVDSNYLQKYGSDMAELSIKRGGVDGWIKDSIPYFYLKFRTKERIIPAIPLILTIEYQSRGNFGFNVSIYNSKEQYKSIDSLKYDLSNSKTNQSVSGKYLFKKDIVSMVNWNGRLTIQTKYLTEFKISKGDTLTGSIEIFCTDLKGKVKIISEKNLFFEYDSRPCYFFSIFDV